MNHRPLQIAVLQILDAAIGQIDHSQPLYGNWSVQGFGILRLYVRSIGRLHIWDSTLRYPGVSLVHNHSWDLRSTIVSGHLMNRRWSEQPFGERFWRQRMLTGFNCEFTQPSPEKCFLIEEPRETYVAGDVYAQRTKQIHLTDAADGTITLMERRDNENGQADLYWREWETWGTARPRPATPEDIVPVVARAIKMLEVAIG